MNHRFGFGIDLGASNIKIAISEIDKDPTNVIEVTQVLEPYRVGAKPTLPSALYIPHPE